MDVVLIRLLSTLGESILASAWFELILSASESAAGVLLGVELAKGFILRSQLFFGLGVRPGMFAVVGLAACMTGSNEL